MAVPAGGIVRRAPPNVIEPGFPAALQENPMASKCELCGKGPSWGMSVSHSHRRTKRRWNPNIQRVRASVNGAAKRVNVCTGCIKSGKIVKAG
jgi:large subunit ribosomal protein L28